MVVISHIPRSYFNCFSAGEYLSEYSNFKVVQIRKSGSTPYVNIVHFELIANGLFLHK